MSFRDTPARFTRTQRTIRNAPLEACAVEQFAPRTRRADGHRYITAACVLAALFVVFILVLEHIA